MKNHFHTITLVLIVLIISFSCETEVETIPEPNLDISFTEITNQYPALDSFYSQGVVSIDLNHDFFPELYFSNSWTASPNHFYKNLGDFKFEKLNIPPFDSDYNNSEGSCWGDYDNDGFSDLLITNDGVNSLYKNIDGKSFKKMHFGSLTDSSGNSNGIIWVDIDLDGDLDIVIANGGNQRNQLFENSGNDNNWVKIKLEGTISNRSAIGAKVIVYSGKLTQHQEIQSQSGGGCGSQKQLLLHFGLGQNTLIDSVQVRWPSSPISTELNLGCNSIITIKE